MLKKPTACAIRTIAVLVVLSSATTCFAQVEKPGYRSVEPRHNTLLVRPGPGEAPMTDINWFARPVLNPDGHWIIGYAMHEKNPCVTKDCRLWKTLSGASKTTGKQKATRQRIRTA